MTCPGCNGKGKPIAHPDAPHASLYECRKCHGLFGSMYLGESYGIVKPFFCKCGFVEKMDLATDFTGRYFDFTALGSYGVTRRHGWYHEACKGLLQVG